MIAATGSPTSYAATGLPAGLVLNTVTGAITGTPTAAGSWLVMLTATNLIGTSSPANLTITVSNTPNVRLRNASVRGNAGVNSNTLIAGFAVSGSGSKNLIVRGIGPTLAEFDLSGALSRPQLTLFNSLGASVAANTVWGGGSVLSAAFSAVGAFALPANSTDSALAPSLSTGGYSAAVTGVNGATGLALVEIYDADPVTSPARLCNFSGRGNAGIGANVLIVGFVLAGNTSDRLLIRGIGPGLSLFNLANVVADPTLTLYDSGGTPIATNTAWGSLPTTGASPVGAAVQAATGLVMSSVGAFPVATNSADCAMVVTLPPGIYTLELSSGSGPSGIGLIELYEIAPN